VAQGRLSPLLALEVAPTPRIHGELLKLGLEVAQSSVAKYMVKRREPPSQGWRAFIPLQDRAAEIFEEEETKLVGALFVRG
jgi:hypothetical protein